MFPGSGGHLGVPRAEAICRGFLNSWMDPYERDGKTGAASVAAAEVSEEMEGTSLETLCLRGEGGGLSFLGLVIRPIPSATSEAETEG